MLGYHWEIVGIVKKDPCRCTGYGANTTDKIRETLSDRSNATVISGGETEGHDRLMSRICNPLVCELFRDPGIREHRLANSRGPPDDQVRRILQTGAEEADCMILA